MDVAILRKGAMVLAVGPLVFRRDGSGARVWTAPEVRGLVEGGVLLRETAAYVAEVLPGQLGPVQGLPRVRVRVPLEGEDLYLELTVFGEDATDPRTGERYVRWACP